MYRVPQNRKITDTTFFVTAALEPRQPIFADAIRAKLVLRSLAFFRSHGEINLYGFVVMPDHVHFVLKVVAPLTISSFMRRFKNFIAHHVNRGPLWEKGFWSEAITSTDLLFQKLEYVHRNPVRSNLVANATDFEWSSARDYLLDLDSGRIDRFDK